LFILTCILTVALLITVMPASAATVTIYNTTAGGISQAINNAGSGGTVILNPGTYFIDAMITISKPITITANTSHGGNPSNTIIDGIRYRNKMFHAPDPGCAMTLDNLTFQHFSNPGYHGGVIYSYRSPVFITSSKFVNCTASYGGAIFIDTSGVTPSSITASGFSGCSATTAGGAIYVMFDQMRITSSTFIDGSAPTGSAVHSENAGTTIHFSRFINNTGTVVYNQNFRAPTGTLDATNDWWGSNANPSGSVGGVGTVNTNPWLKLGTTADAVLITSTQTARIRANLTFNSNGADTSGSGRVPDGIPVAFGITGGTGSILPAAGNITSGSNTTVFTPSGGGTSQVNATVDNESLSVLITTLNASFTGKPSSGTVPLTVAFTDASGGSPAMWNWSFGDGRWFNTTDTAARSPTHIYTSTGTYTVNLTVSRASVTDTLSKAGYISVSALPTPTTVPPTITPTSVPVNGGDDPPASPPAGTATTGSTNVGGRSSIISVTVTGTGITDLIITGMPLAGSGTGIPPAPGTVYEYVDLVPSRFLTISGATIVFAVPSAWLEEHRLDPRDVVLYHYSGSGWTALPTTPGETVNGFTLFTSTTTGSSLYAISAVPHTGEHVSATPTLATIGELAGVSAHNNPTTEPTSVQAPAVVSTETTAVPAPGGSGTATPLPSAMPAAAGLMILAAGGFMARRWWRRRQNPALFVEYE